MYTYHSYPVVLQNLTLVKEVGIAYTHLIMILIHLRPSGLSVFVFYSRIRRYIVVFPQQPGLLLKLLVSNTI